MILPAWKTKRRSKRLRLYHLPTVEKDLATAKPLGRVVEYFFAPRYRFSRFQFNLVAVFFITVGLVAGTYFTLTEAIPRIFALNDTAKIWTFNTANSSQYTYDTSLVTVDDAGAHPVANKLTNPAFVSDNSSWSTAAVPPSGWVEVPGSGTYSTTNFLSMKYEAKCAATSDPATGLTSPATAFNTYDNAATACTSGNNRQVVSVASGYPIANISHDTAKTYCQNTTLNGNAVHLITNPEWMTIARGAEAQAGNWTGGSVGSGYLFAGHNDNVPALARVASTTDTDNYRCAYTDGSPGTEAPSACPTNTANGQSGTAGNQVRTLSLSSGAVIWDVAGNIWEHVQVDSSDTKVSQQEQPEATTDGTNPITDTAYTLSDFTGSGSTRRLLNNGTEPPLGYNVIRPLSSSYDASYGVGRIYHWSNSSSSTKDRVFLRGGNWDDTSYAGAFTLHLDWTSSSTSNDVGFRCASDPVAISQSWSSSSGRAGGGNTVTIGSISDGKIYQSVNVGDTSTYDFSVYVYDNTTGNVGGTVASSIAQLYYNGATISTTYTNAGSGWWKLSGTLTGANASREYGVLVKAGKTVKVDDLTLSKQGTYSVYTTTAYSNAQVNTWDTFCEGTLSGSTCTPDATYSGNAAIKYQICTDDGSTCQSGSSWKYWNGSAWAAATDTTTTVNTAAQLTQTAMQALPITSQKISVKAIFTFGGSDTPYLPHISIGLTTDTTPPTTNASGIAMTRSNGGTSVSSNGWTNNTSPYFSWTAGADNSGGSGVKGYCLYLGTDANGDPATAKGLLGTSPVSTAGTTCQFIVSGTSIDFANSSYRGAPWLTSSSSSYYFNVKVVDNSGNIFTGASAQFQFRFDNTAPANPSFISSPGDFVSTYEVTLTWPTSAPQAASDANSGVAGLQYRIGSAGTWYGDLHSGTQDENDLLANDGVYTTVEIPDYDGSGTDDLGEGINLIYFRTWDAAGNITTSSVSAGVKINTTAPSAPQNLSVSPSSNTVNSFAFSWNPPATYEGLASNITYCYTVNTLPSALTCTFTSPGVTSLAADAFANQPGSNTFYLAAKDEAGNINYAVSSSVAFTANTSAPGISTNVEIADASIKETSAWKLALAWEPPSDVGAGVASYKVYRSTTETSCSASFGSFSNVATTTGTSFLDTGLTQTNHSYCVKACDSANNCSAASSTATEYPTGRWKVAASLTSGPVASPVTTRRAVIAWTTGRGADSKVAFGVSSGSYFEAEPSVAAQVPSHSITLTNLKPGTTYFYQAKWTDEDGNTGESSERTFTTQSAPTIKDVIVSSINIDSAIVNLTATNAAKVKIYYGSTTSFGGGVEQETAATESRYQVQLSNLLDGTKYYYQINPFDTEGEEYDQDVVLDFTTYPRPRITNVRIQELSAATSTVEVSWESNTPISSVVTFYPLNSPQQARDAVKLARVVKHKVEVPGLRPAVDYILIARGFDPIGNEAVSDSQKFTTATDTRPPVIFNVQIETSIQGIGSEARAQVIISWETDEPATGQLEYGAGAGATYTNKTPEDPSLIFYHLQVMTDLSPSEVYHLRILTKDEVGNETVGTDYIVITPERTNSALDLIITNLAETFRFLGGMGGFLRR